MTDKQEPRLPAGAPAARSRWVQVPAGSVVVTLTPTEWAAAHHALDEHTGKLGLDPENMAMQRAARKVQDAREQLAPE